MARGYKGQHYAEEDTSAGKGAAVKHAVIVILTVFFFIIAAIISAVTVICRGPSDSARNIFVMTCLETSALKFVPRIYFSEAAINEMIEFNSVKAAQASTDTRLIEITAREDSESEKQVDDIVIEDVTGPTYKGKMMLVKDPSMVKVGVSGAFSAGGYGKKLEDIVELYGAAGGVNGGGFIDENGSGKGGEPQGIVIAEGELKWGSPAATYSLIGFDSENRFVTGTMTAQKALDSGIRDAVTYGPALIVNGEPASVFGMGGGLNPRTAIGQRSDGTVLILVVDGRQPSSLGANFSDLVNIMTEYGAVNAANLDGGSSSQMVYDGKSLTNCCSFGGARWIPTCILIDRQEQAE